MPIYISELGAQPCRRMGFNTLPRPEQGDPLHRTDHAERANEGMTSHSVSPTANSSSSSSRSSSSEPPALRCALLKASGDESTVAGVNDINERVSRSALVLHAL